MKNLNLKKLIVNTLALSVLVAFCHAEEGSGNCTSVMTGMSGGSFDSPNCSGTQCTANWDGSHWIVKDHCKNKDCICDAPEVTFATAPGAENSFDCVAANKGATAERFFLTLCGDGTGIHRFQFDKSDVDMFKGYFLKVKHDTKTVWRIKGTWDASSYEPVPKNDGKLDATDPASVVLRCDTDKFGDMSQSVTFKKGEVVKFEFGAWDVEIEYYDK